ncbi:kinesin-like protein KIF20B [Strix uralensis]|uniref:kinesin-like protein KIF20B n=1 Tax=Strix uralensis TaxID=36305 RepID=UPI003DA6EC2A
MEPNLDKEDFFRPSCIAGVEPLQRTAPGSVEDFKTDISPDLSLVSSSSNTSQRSSLEPKGHIPVCLCIRPLTSLERENELQVFAPETTQEFFDGTMKQPVQDFLDGYNHLIFTYGVRNAGNTYTFQGRPSREHEQQSTSRLFGRTLKRPRTI